jgi:hypothetical protein
VAYGNGTYVASGDESLVLTSPDGADWTIQSHVPIDHFWEDTDYTTLVYGNGRFVALDSYRATLMTSTDGKTWHATSPGGPGVSFGALTFGGGQFVAGTPGGMVVSADGERWQLVYPADRLQYRGIAWSGSQYLVVALDQNQQPVELTSTDGVSWQMEPFSPGPVQGLAYGNGRFVTLAIREDAGTGMAHFSNPKSFSI